MIPSGFPVTPRLDRRDDLFRLVSLMPGDEQPMGPDDAPLGTLPAKDE